MHQKMSTWLPRTSYRLFHDVGVEIHYFCYEVCSTRHRLDNQGFGSTMAISDLVEYFHFRLDPLATLWICSTLNSSLSTSMQ